MNLHLEPVPSDGNPWGSAVAVRLEIAGWSVAPDQNRLVKDGQQILLEPKIMDILLCLVRANGETVSRSDMLDAVWPEIFVADDSLYRGISHLRRSFAPYPELREAIVTVARRGYRLSATALSREEQAATDLRSPPPILPAPLARFPLPAFRWVPLAVLLGLVLTLEGADEAVGVPSLASPVQAAITSGQELYSRYRYQDNENAILLFQRAAAADPKAAAAKAGLANALAQRYFLWSRDPADLERAIESARAALAADPASAEAHKALGMALEYAGRFDSALQSYLAALERDPDHWASIVNIGDLHRKRGEFGLARNWYERARRIGGDTVQTALRLGHTETALRRFGPAMAWYQLILDREPLHPQASAGIARARLYKGDTSGALEACAPIVQRLSRDMSCHIAMGETLLLTGRVEEAAGHFDAVALAGPSKWAAYIEFRQLHLNFLRDGGRREPLQSFLLRYQHRPGDSHDAYRYRALAAAAAVLERIDEAVIFLRQARENGWSDRNWDRIDPAFDRFRTDPKFLAALGPKPTLVNRQRQFARIGARSGHGGRALV